MNLDELRTQFLGYLQIRNYSPRTVSDYGYHLGSFFRFLEQKAMADVRNVTTATLTDFQRWFYYQPTKRRQARGVVNQNLVLATVKSFFRFLKNEGLIHADPAAAVEYARAPRSLPRNVLTPQEALRILEAIDTTTALGYRDRVMLEVFYATGLRNRELRQLTVADVNLEEELLRVNSGKGGHDRVVPLSQIACKFLETYLKGVRPQLVGGKATDTLFVSLRGNPLDGHTVGDFVKKYARLARVKKHVTPHVWRHTCATHLVQNEANLRHVQDILGHRSLNTTERYLRLTITDLKEAHRKFHPRERGGASAQL